MVFTVFREGCIFQNSSIQAPNLYRIYQIFIIFFDINFIKKPIKHRHFWVLRIWSHFGPVLDLILTPFWHNFWGFWGVLGPLAPILAARGPPRPLPRGLLGSLGVPKSLQTTILVDFGLTWSHFGGPGFHFGWPGLHFGALGLRFAPSLQASKPASLQASKPASLQACKPARIL